LSENLIEHSEGAADEEGSIEEDSKFTFEQAFALNALNMFGTGPFVTLPLVMSANGVPGPQNLIGYALAALLCILDSHVWAELSSKIPSSGGTYAYLRNCYGRETWGRLMSFLFIWQFLVSAPMEVASGFLAMARYLSYVTSPDTVGDEHPLTENFTALVFCGLATALLYKDVAHVGATTQILWAGTVMAIVATLVAGFSHFDADNFGSIPAGALEMPGILGSIAIAMRLGVYDMAGYYDVCYLADNVQEPRKNVPRAVVGSACTISVVYGLVYIAILGYLPWGGEHGFTNQASLAYQHVMSIFFERMCGHVVAVVFTCVVVFTIFGSSFAMMLGYISIRMQRPTTATSCSGLGTPTRAIRG